jgi:hypothetical protein
MAAFFKSSVLAIRHNLFIDNCLQQIFTCYKMAMCPLLARHFGHLVSTHFSLLISKIQPFG